MNPDALFSVADQVVLVAGASRGIGRAIAEGFAQRGAKVIITGREEKTLANFSIRESLGNEAQHIQLTLAQRLDKVSGSG